MRGDTTLVHTRDRTLDRMRHRQGECVFRVTRRTLGPQGASGGDGGGAAGRSMTSPDPGDHICFPFEADAATPAHTADFVANGIRHHRVVLTAHALAPAELHAVLAARVPRFTAAVDADMSPAGPDVPGVPGVPGVP